ncbi:hypothetical protein [Streptomyces sp. OP7]
MAGGADPILPPRGGAETGFDFGAGELATGRRFLASVPESTRATRTP